MAVETINNREARMTINWDSTQLINERGAVLADLNISYITPYPIGFQFKRNGYVIQIYIPESKAKLLATKCLIAGKAETLVSMDYRYVGEPSW